MSAYIVSNETINCIVNGMLDNNVIGTLSAEEIGQQLLDENYKSVNYRYDEDEEPARFAFKRKGNIMIVNSGYTDTEVWGCIRCWKYQSCEHPDDERGRVWGYVDSLEYHLMEKAFPDAPWGLDD